MEYQELYKIGFAQLADNEIAEAALDARLLLEFVCNTNRNDLLVHGEREVEKEKEEKYLELIRIRSNHIPLQHITGVQDFMGLEFTVNENVLIPRQDTEILVEEVLKELHDGMSVLDMCTGSGCILVSLLFFTNNCRGTGVDLSEKALEVAKKNADKLLADRMGYGDMSYEFLASNLFEKVEGKYDRIVSNPPYIRSDVIPSLMPEVKNHEPIMALDGAEDGLYFYREIISQSIPHLNGGGILYFEIGYDQGEAVSSLMAEAGFKEIQVIQDYAGLDRVVYGML